MGAEDPSAFSAGALCAGPRGGGGVALTRRTTGRARIGVDIGGTFTDLVLLVEGRVAAVAKTLTTPADPSLAVAGGVARLLGQVPPAAVGEVVHGTTLVSNALIERTGAVTCLVTTAGVRDALAIRREHRYDLYDLFLELPEPLVPRRRRWEVSERVLADGTVDRPLDEAEVRRVAGRARRAGVEAVAVCFLHAYRHPDHERRAAAVLAEELPGVPVSVSSDVVPELGEYVRASTTVANAYVRPLVDGYLETLERRLAAAGVRAPLHLMLSTGGLAGVETGRRFPVRLTESGPAAGAIGAAFLGQAAGERDVLAFDMGGTTAKACLVEAGQPLLAREHEVARVHRFAPESGLPLRVPVIDLIEIGAGGGSVARVDRFGLPKVGPESAGAEPGPACYGRGGDRPTVTDADLLLGYLDPAFFLGGEMALDVRAARAAVGRLAAALGLEASEAPPASTRSSTRAWPRPRACTPSSAAATSGASRWWRPAAPARSTPGAWPAAWASGGSSCPRRQASRRRSACSRRRRRSTTRAACPPGWATWTGQRCGGPWSRCGGTAPATSGAPGWRPATSRCGCRRTCATAARARGSPWRSAAT